MGFKGINGSGNGCYDNSKEKLIKGIINIYECKCVWYWIMWIYFLVDFNIIFEFENKCFSIYYM